MEAITKNILSPATTSYIHAKYETRRWFLRFLLRAIGFTLLARVDRVEDIQNVPSQGPAILMINHIALIDPIVVMHLLPRNIVPLAKIEVYNYPIIGIFPKIWGVVPVRREDIDRNAIRQVLAILEAGEIVLMAPEGTRSPQLQKARGGVAFIGSHSGVPIVPVAIENTIGFPTLRFSKRWKGPGAVVRFGKPFRFQNDLNSNGHDHIQKMTDEAMYQLAGMLPENQRGYYSDLSQATQDTIEWVFPDHPGI